MKFIVNILFLCLISLPGFSQPARVNITSGYLKLGVSGNGTASTPTYFILDDSNTTALTASAGSGIISSGEFNMVEWNIGKSSVGSAYVLPFMSDNLTSISLTATITTVGANNVAGKNASVEFSTWHTVADQLKGVTSTTGLPSDCNNVYTDWSGRGSPSALDNSYNVVDRFWVIDALSSAGKAYKAASNPAMSVIFTYLASGSGTSEVSFPNVFTDGSLWAQRYNPTINTWGDYIPVTNSDVVGGNTSVLTTAAVSASNFFRDWTLANSNSPLPIKLIGFTAQCQNYDAVLNWSTATENNNDHFTIERTQDGVNYEQVAIIKGAGNSSSTLSYSAIDHNPFPGTSYYRLSQTDIDGNTENLGTILFNHCSDEATTINAYTVNKYINIVVNSIDNSDESYTISMCNALGQVVLTETKTVAKGYNEFKLYPNAAEGVYFITVNNSVNLYHKKILLQK